MSCQNTSLSLPLTSNWSLADTTCSAGAAVDATGDLNSLLCQARLYKKYPKYALLCLFQIYNQSFHMLSVL